MNINLNTAFGSISMVTIQNALRSLGVTQRYKGFMYTSYAVYLVVCDDSRLEAVTKEIYMETASHFGCTWTAIERNIRTVTTRAWKVNRPLLLKMAGYPLTNPPVASEFIEILASYVLRSYQLQS